MNIGSSDGFLIDCIAYYDFLVMTLGLWRCTDSYPSPISSRLSDLGHVPLLLQASVSISVPVTSWSGFGRLEYNVARASYSAWCL